MFATRYTPLDQFDIKNIFSIEILGNILASFTNMDMYLIISCLIIISFSLLFNTKRIKSNA